MTRFFYLLEVGQHFTFQGDVYEKVDDESAVEVGGAGIRDFNPVDMVWLHPD